jgi:hypothetical protein
MKSRSTKYKGRNWTVDGITPFTCLKYIAQEYNRLSYDAAVTKFEKLKGSKKEKEKREGEDEMERARDR